MTSKIFSIAQFGLHGQLVEIEVDSSNGLPGITIVGLPDKAVEEARERIRSAIKNSGFSLPPKRFTINLIPADIPKKGSLYDLPIALAILQATGQIGQNVSDSVVAAELGLDGTLKPNQSSLVAAEIARAHHKPSIYLPAASAAQATLIDKVAVYPVVSLRQLILHLLGEHTIKPLAAQQLPSHTHDLEIDMADIYGQEAAKRAMVIAAAGNHNVLLSGSPGSGKTMLAQATVGLLPRPSQQEIIEISKIHSLVNSDNQLIASRPFRNPHHTASDIAIIGGGQWPKPGEISLAHRGVLFLDEIAEFKRGVLEVLRQPLEEGYVSIARANGRYRFPAQFMLIAAQNPCPCGYYGDTHVSCSCSLSALIRYQTKLSGPLLDRIDLLIHVARPETQSIISHTAGVSSAQLAASVKNAREIQRKRFGNTLSVQNGKMNNSQIKQFCKLDGQTEKLARSAVEKLHLSARAYYRVLKIARTIADLDNAAEIRAPHLTEAISYRTATKSE